MKQLLKAIKVCGSQAELARRMGGKTRTGHIYYWLKHGIPAERCAEVERATNGKVTRQQLLPSVFGDISKAA